MCCNRNLTARLDRAEILGNKQNAQLTSTANAEQALGRKASLLDGQLVQTSAERDRLQHHVKKIATARRQSRSAMHTALQANKALQVKPHSLQSKHSFWLLVETAAAVHLSSGLCVSATSILLPALQTHASTASDGVLLQQDELTTTRALVKEGTLDKVCLCKC